MRKTRTDADTPLDLSAAAVDAGCHFATIDRAVRSGELPFSWHPGRRKRIVLRADLEAWKARRAAGGSARRSPNKTDLTDVALALSDLIAGGVK